MIRKDRMFGFAPGLLATCLLATPLLAPARDKPREHTSKTAAPVAIVAANEPDARTELEPAPPRVQHCTQGAGPAVGPTREERAR